MHDTALEVATCIFLAVFRPGFKTRQTHTLTSRRHFGFMYGFVLHHRGQAAKNIFFEPLTILL